VRAGLDVKNEPKLVSELGQVNSMRCRNHEWRGLGKLTSDGSNR